MSQKNPHEGHRERLKKRFIENGIEGLEEHEALELLLFYAIPYRDTNYLAHDLIEHFGSFTAVFDAPIEELCKVKDMTEHRAVLLKLVHSMENKYLQSNQKNITTINSTDAAGKYFAAQFYGLKVERFLAVYLNNQSKLLKCSIISEGSINRSSVNIRKIIEDIVALNATSVILAHNHPGGVAEPSEDDIKATRQIINSLAPFNVRVFDHIIVADNKYLSLASAKEYGMMFLYDC